MFRARYIQIPFAQAGGGLKGITASGAELPEPENGGKLLHQRWFRPGETWRDTLTTLS